MRIIIRVLGLIFLSGLANITLAEENKKAEGISGAAEFGLVLTTGNTNNSTTTGKFKVTYDARKWLHNFNLNIVNAQTDGTRTAERYFFTAKSDYKLKNERFLFVGLTHYIDKFSGFAYQSAVTFGYGKNFYDTKDFKFSAEIGPGYRVSEFDTGGNEEEAIFHLGSKSRYLINKYTSLSAKLSIDSGTNQTISILDLGYINQLSNALALKVGYNVKNSSNAPVGNKRLDSITSMSLLYSF